MHVINISRLEIYCVLLSDDQTSAYHQSSSVSVDTP